MTDVAADAGLELELMERQLYGERASTPLTLPWLEPSQQQPRAFWELLKRIHDRSAPLPAKSVPFVEYDFYNDIIRRRPAETAALVWYDAEGRRALSYGELGARADRLAAAWAAAGAAAGQIACVVLPVGASLAAALLAALKLGLVVSLLPPLGRAFLARRLELLAADHLVTSEIYATLFGEWQGGRLSVDEQTIERAAPPTPAGGDEAAVRGHGYPSGSPAALLFDPCMPPGDEIVAPPTPLSADAAYLLPLRDALLGIGLRPRQVLAGAGLHPLETQPALLLSCLLVGATYLHLEPEDLERNPGALSEPLRALALDERARDLLLEQPLPSLGERCHHWIRNPAGSRHLEAWQRFVEANGLQQAWALNLKWDAARGGASLLSPRRLGLAHGEVLPPAGVAWQAGDLLDPTQPAGSDHGAVFYASPEAESVDEGQPTASVIGRHGGVWYFGGSLAVGRQGRHYPLAEALAALEPEVERGVLPPLSLFDVPRGADGGDPLIVLVAFVGLPLASKGAPLDQAALRRTLLQRLQGAMGDEFLPDRVMIYELLPRRDEEGAVDHAWCKDQYIRGELHRKAGDELYGCITGLRERIVEPMRGASAGTETEDQAPEMEGTR